MEILPHTPPTPPHEKNGISTHSYLAIFSAAFLRTLAVGLGITLFVVIAGVTAEVTEERQCNVSVRTLYGELTTYSYGGDETDSGALVRALLRDDNDENIKAVILDIDSPGGLPVAGEEIANQLSRLAKPNAAVIRSVGASAAYWAASGADIIFASQSSDVGSIGVIVSFPDESEKNKRDGVVYNEFASGKYKNLGTPTRPVTNDEKELLEEGIADVYEHFLSSVAMLRNMDIEKVRAHADGSTFAGVKAKERGLIDAIGGIEEARAYVEEQIGEEAVLCEPNAEPLF